MMPPTDQQLLRSTHRLLIGIARDAIGRAPHYLSETIAAAEDLERALNAKVSLKPARIGYTVPETRHE